MWHQLREGWAPNSLKESVKAGSHMRKFFITKVLPNAITIPSALTLVLHYQWTVFYLLNPCNKTIHQSIYWSLAFNFWTLVDEVYVFLSDMYRKHVCLLSRVALVINKFLISQQHFLFQMKICPGQVERNFYCTLFGKIGMKFYGTRGLSEIR